MTTKSFAAALVSIALILLAVVIIVVPASAVGQCGEASCGKIFADDCSPSQRCVSKWGGYYCVDDPTCSSAPSEAGTPTTTSTPAPITGSSCSSSGGVCRYWTGFYCYSGESDIGKKDCGSGQTCCKKSVVAPTATPTKTPTPAGTATPTKTPTPIPSTTTTCGDSWCGTFGRSCRPTEKCVASKLVWVFHVYHCVEDSACSGSAPADSGSTCGDSVCNTGAGGESYLNCPADCPKPMTYYYTTKSISECLDGTPRFTCSNSTPGKYCDGLGKLVTLARCSAPSATTPAAVGGTCAAAGGACKLIAQSGDEDVGKKDCKWGWRCYKKSEAAKQERIKFLNEVCGKKGCGTLDKVDCLQTQMCEEVGRMGPVPGGLDCVYEKECAELKVASLQTYIVTAIFELGAITKTERDVGNYYITVSAIDSTTRRVSIKVGDRTGTGSGLTYLTKIVDEGSTYQFFGSNIDGGVEIKVNTVIEGSTELAITYKG